jgi:hypothetical protein
MIKTLSKPFKWFFQLEAASGLILLIAAIVALYISNSVFSEFYFSSLNKYLFIGINGFGRFGLHLLKYWLDRSIESAFRIDYINDDYHCLYHLFGDVYQLYFHYFDDHLQKQYGYVYYYYCL